MKSEAFFLKVVDAGHPVFGNDSRKHLFEYVDREYIPSTNGSRFAHATLEIAASCCRYNFPGNRDRFTTIRRSIGTTRSESDPETSPSTYRVKALSEECRNSPSHPSSILC
jgi:hypothetical protein